MKILTTDMQLEMLGAAWKLTATIRELSPGNWEALAAVGVITANIFPTFEELADGARRLQLPEMTRELYDSLYRDALALAAPATETQH